jgi:hypothetical protein
MEAFVIEQGKIFIEGVETMDPILIGYTIIDMIQEGKKVTIDNSIEEVFNEKDIVFVTHDPDQEPRMIVGIEISNDSVVYNCMCGTTLSNHYAYELSKNKNLTL